MQNKSTEVLEKLKELRNIAYETEQLLERSGLSITDMSKAQLFDYNIKNIIGSTEAILRNEAPERPMLRLQKDIPDSYINLDKLSKTNPGKLNSAQLNRIKELIGYIESVYSEL